MSDRAANPSSIQQAPHQQATPLFSGGAGRGKARRARWRALLSRSVLVGVPLLAVGGAYGAAVHAGWHVDEGAVVGWTGFYLHVGQDCSPPLCTPDNPGEFDPLILTCRLTREPLGAAHPHLDWPRCTLRRP